MGLIVRLALNNIVMDNQPLQKDNYGRAGCGSKG
jgi:hypothetical protein